MKLLVVDDSNVIRNKIIRTLQIEGVEVVGTARNGREAVNLFAKFRPELVTMDITMPEMDGIQALKEIKKIDANARVIMCTAMGQKTMVIEAVQSGAKDFIVKPFQPDRVVEAMNKVAA